MLANNFSQALSEGRKKIVSPSPAMPQERIADIMDKTLSSRPQFIFSVNSERVQVEMASQDKFLLKDPKDAELMVFDFFCFFGQDK